MPFETWLMFCATEAVLCFTPGPAVLLVCSLGLTRGLPAGLRAAAGVLVTNAGYFALSATGIGAILVTSWELFVLVKWVGAAYLVWLGASMLFARRGASPEAAVANGRFGARGANGRFGPARGANGRFGPARGANGRFGPFAHGLVTQGANPKTLLFFSALLPQFVHPDHPVAFQVAVLGASSVAIEAVALAIYAVATDRARRLARTPRLETVLSRAGGALLIGAGAGLAALRRD